MVTAAGKPAVNHTSPVRSPGKEERMKQIFVEDPTHEKPMETLENEYPWYAEIVKVDGGWMIFESAEDFFTWESQK